MYYIHGVIFHLHCLQLFIPLTPLSIRRHTGVWREKSEKYNCSWILGWREFIQRWVRNRNEEIICCVFLQKDWLVGSGGLIGEEQDLLNWKADGCSVHWFIFLHSWIQYGLQTKQNIPAVLDGFIGMHCWMSVLQCELMMQQNFFCSSATSVVFLNK